MEPLYNKYSLPQEIYLEHLQSLNGIKLSKREIDIIACTLSGRSAKGTAHFLSLSPKTVEAHSYNAMKKLGCTSREAMIDLIETSDEFYILKDYYLNLQVFYAFEQTLKKIIKLSSADIHQKECLLVSWEKNNAYFFNQLKAHLEYAGITAILEMRKDKQTLSQLFRETRKVYTIYVIPNTWEISSEENRQETAIEIFSIQDHFASNLLFLFTGKAKVDKFSGVVSNVPIINYLEGDNYYLLVTKVLKIFFPTLNFDQALLQFENNGTYLNRPFLTAKSSDTLKTVTPEPRFIKIFTSRKLRWLLSTSLFLFFVAFALYLFTERNSEQKQISYSFGTNQPFNMGSPNAFFSGRHDELAQIEEAVFYKKENIVALAGLPGIGKTTLAKEFFWKHQKKFDIALYLNCAQDLKSQLLKFAQAWNKSQTEFSQMIPDAYMNLNDAYNILTIWLPHHPASMFIILDDVQNTSQGKELISCFRGKPSQVILLTSRKATFWKAPIILHKFKRDESIELLKKFLPRSIENFNELAMLLEDYPLALSQAGLLIKILPSLTVQEYKNIYQAKRSSLEQLHDKINREAPENIEYTTTIFAALSLSLDELKKRHPDAYNVLEYLSFLHLTSISEDNIKDCLQILSIEKEKLHDILFELLSYFYLAPQFSEKKENQETKIYSMHSIVQQSLREKITSQRRTEILSFWAKYFAQKFLLDTYRLEEYITQFPENYNHTRNLVNYIGNEKLTIPGYLELKIDLCFSSQYIIWDEELHKEFTFQIEKELINKEKTLSPFIQARFYHILGGAFLLDNPAKTTEYIHKAMGLLERVPGPKAKFSSVYLGINDLAIGYISGEIERSFEIS